MDMQDQQRTHRRFPALFDVVWQGESGVHRARTNNISIGGCYLYSMGATEVGEPIKLKIRLNGEEYLYLIGQVVHYSALIGFGVRFANLSEDDKTRLQTAIKAAAEKPEEDEQPIKEPLQ